MPEASDVADGREAPSFPKQAVLERPRGNGAWPAFGPMLLFVCLLGLAVRLWGADFGVPHSYHMEEPFYIDAAWNLACLGDANSPLLQSHTYAEAILIRVLRPLDLGISCDVIPSLMPTMYLIVGRVLSAVSACAALITLALLGSRLYGMKEGLLAALLLALNFLHVRDSHFGTPDIAATLLATASLLSYSRILQGRTKSKDYILAAALTALSTNARPTAILLLLPFLYAHLHSQGMSRRWSIQQLRKALFTKEMHLAIGAFGALTAILHPQAWLDPISFLKYWASFSSLGDLGGFGRLQVDPRIAPLYYLVVLEWSAGILLTLLMLGGVALAVARGEPADRLSLGFALPYVALASVSTVYFARYALPVIPLLCLFASRLVLKCLPNRNQVTWVALIGVAVLVQPVGRILRFSYIMRQDDTRTLAEAWFEREIPHAAKVAAEWHTPDIRGYDVTVVGFYGLSQEPLQAYVDEGYDYLIVSSFIRDAQMILPEEEARKMAFYQQLRATMPLVAQFSPYVDGVDPPYEIDQVLGPITHLFEIERPGPQLEIYRIEASPPDGAGLPVPILTHLPRPSGDANAALP